MSLMFRCAALLFIMLMAGCSITPMAPPVLTPYADGRDWVLLKPLRFEVVSKDGTKSQVEVPEGFVTDLASVPRAFWAVVPPFGKYMTGAILHDYLYWTGACKQKDADKILYQAMIDSGSDEMLSKAFYEALSIAGKSTYASNEELRSQGYIRFLPEVNVKPMPMNISWADYQKKLFDQGIRMKTPSPTDQMKAFCSELGKDVVVKTWLQTIPISFKTK